MITCDNGYIIEPTLTRDETYYIIIKRKINDHPLYFKSDEKRGVVHIDSRELYFIFFFFASCMRRFVISLLGIGAVSCIVCRRESGFVRQCPLITYLTGWELRSASAAQSCVLTDVTWSTKKTKWITDHSLVSPHMMGARPALIQSRASVRDAGPALNQRWVIVVMLIGNQAVIFLAFQPPLVPRINLCDYQSYRTSRQIFSIRCVTQEPERSHCRLCSHACTPDYMWLLGKLKQCQNVISTSRVVSSASYTIHCAASYILFVFYISQCRSFWSRIRLIFVFFITVLYSSMFFFYTVLNNLRQRHNFYSDVPFPPVSSCGSQRHYV